jgi:antitoxin VapB
VNKHNPIEAEASLFKSNRSQAVRIPKALAFPDTVKKVRITRLDDGLLIKPAAAQRTWAEYFSRPSRLTQEDADEWLKAVGRDEPPDPVPSLDD